MFRGDSVEKAVRDDGIRFLQEGVAEIETNALLSLLYDRDTAERARRMFSNVRALGNALGEVKCELPELYKVRQSNGRSFWEVKQEEVHLPAAELSSLSEVERVRNGRASG
jgi:hypothetical protein